MSIANEFGHERLTPDAACALCGVVVGGSLCIAAVLRAMAQRLGVIQECLLGPTEFAPPAPPSAVEAPPSDDLGLDGASATEPDGRIKRRRGGVGLWEWRRVKPSYIRVASTLNVGTHDHDGRRPRVWLTAEELRRVRAFHAAPTPAVASLEALITVPESNIVGPLTVPPEAVLPPTGDDGGDRPHAGTIRLGGFEYVRGTRAARDGRSDWPDGKYRERYPNNRGYLPVARRLGVGRIVKINAEHYDLWITKAEGDTIRARLREDYKKIKSIKAKKRKNRANLERVRKANAEKRSGSQEPQ